MDGLFPFLDYLIWMLLWRLLPQPLLHCIIQWICHSQISFFPGYFHFYFQVH
jgi:hypothetical protein